MVQTEFFSGWRNRVDDDQAGGDLGGGAEATIDRIVQKDCTISPVPIRKN